MTTDELTELGQRYRAMRYEAAQADEVRPSTTNERRILALEYERDELRAEVERLRAIVQDHSLSAQQIVQRLRTHFDRTKPRYEGQT